MSTYENIVNTAVYKKQLEDKLSQVKYESLNKIDDGKCKHEYKHFKETIRPERTRANEIKGYVYKKGQSYFVVKACELCKEKVRISLVIEP